MGGQPVLISRTGWTAELGFEVYNLEANVDGLVLWDHLLRAGEPQGMEVLSTYSMNPRRIEAGIMNYGTDMNWDTTPFDLGLGAFVDFEHDFIGREALLKADRRSRFSGCVTAAEQVKWNSPVFSNGVEVGKIKAFAHSPTLDTRVGYILFDSADSMKGNHFIVRDRDGKEHSLRLQAPPFFDPETRIPRGLEAMEFKG